jgi:hypothetical protein
MANLPRRTFLHAIAGATALVACGQFAAAAPEALPAGRRIALNGHDPISYFTDGRPEKGMDEFWFAFDDTVYLFRNAEHRALFAGDPERYAPQYAGFCAGGVYKGYKTEPDPEAWTIVNGRLFVMQRKDFVPEFKRDSAAIIGQADTNWPKLHDAPIR